ncbi:MAG: hypothetical protein QNL01_09025 [Akkermansiaceae bacterium]|jgi:hypothetical protein|tara:strand:+ start:7258 stop:9687 length:2430 start_codon:yes stop_codon:yes gene_type:complete
MTKVLFHSAIRLVAISLALWGLFWLLGRVLQYGTSWSIMSVAATGALAAELIVWLYRYERSAVVPRKGRWLLALRLTALLGLLWMLLQPVWSRKVEREIVREVVVLIDDSASMHLKDDGSSTTRQEIGQRALDESGLLKELDGKVNVRTLRAARKVLSANQAANDGWDQATDLAGALSTVLEQIPADNLGGVVLLSDGRHNRPGRVEDVARRFGILDAPIAAIALGSDAPPRDAAILSVLSPDAVYLGDRIKVSARLKFDGYRGKQAKVKLLQGDTVLEEQTISIAQDRHREDVKFRHTPEKGGVTGYRLEMSPIDGERFKNNNSWSFETAVTDARTNVLIIDSHARWEFRYLRNLFYGRDKSIHLQYVLLNPDRIEGQKDEPIAASAARPFGEARATKLPVSEDEWRKFDVIILGDIAPDSLTADHWKILKSCVQDRGSLLVTVAGPRWMPHAHRNPVLEGLLPVEYDLTDRNYFGSGEKGFKMALTSEGRAHPVTAQSDSRIENARLWSGFPVMRWRHPITGVKEGAEVLLMAKSGSEKAPAAPRSADELGSALEALTKRKQEEQKNALLVAQQVGNGKVAMLLTDRTWRLREGVGDVHHHRLWGQLVRWGAGPNLRSGTAGVRLGTDQLTYSADDRVEITARLRDKNLLPVKDPSLHALIHLNGKQIASVPMKYMTGSNGLHRALAGPFAQQGNYEITLQGAEVDTLLGGSDASIKTGIRVIGAKSPVELSETTLNRPLLETIAELSGGRVIEPNQTSSLASLFLTGDETREELRETTLWDHWLLLIILLAVLTAEWMVRRGAGLP